MLYKIYFLSHKFAFSNLRFFAILRTFSSITRDICDETKNKVHHVNQLIEPDLIMYIYITFIKIFHATPFHSTELFKIFFSLLTLSTAFCKKLVGREKMHVRNTVNVKANLLFRICGIKVIICSL